MRKTVCAVGLFSLVSTFLPFALVAQEHYTEGPVWRLTLLRITPGKTDAFFNDFRQNVRSTYDEMKKQKLILDYKIYLNSTSSGLEDWQVAIGFQYANYGALDGLASKTASIGLKQYGSKEGAQQAVEKRLQNATVVGSRIMREINLK